MRAVGPLVGGVTLLLVIASVGSASGGGVVGTDAITPTPIDSCTTITEPGEYVLTDSINVNTDRFWYPNTYTCIRIRASDVTFDGDGNQIQDLSKASNSQTTGISAVPPESRTGIRKPLDNVAVENVRLVGWHTGVSFDGVGNGAIENTRITGGIGLSAGIHLNYSTADLGKRYTTHGTTVSGNTITDHWRGILVNRSDDNVLTGNTVKRNSGGIQIDRDSKNNVLMNNTVNVNSGSGISVHGENHTLTDNTANSNELWGISFTGYDYTVTDNTANSNELWGIWGAKPTANSLLKDNTANFNGGAGIRLSFADNTTVTNNVATSNGVGIRLRASENTTLNENTIAAKHDGDGIHLAGSSNNTLTGNTITATEAGLHLSGLFSSLQSANNTIADTIAVNNAAWAYHSDSEAGINRVENFTIDSETAVSFRAREVALQSVPSPPPEPADAENVSVFVNATATGDNAWLFLNASYTNAAVAGLDESQLRLWRYDDAGTWATVVGSGVNVGENEVYGNVTNFSVIAPLYEPPPVTPTPTPTATPTSTASSSNSSLQETPTATATPTNAGLEATPTSTETAGGQTLTATDPPTREPVSPMTTATSPTSGDNGPGLGVGAAILAVLVLVAIRHVSSDR